MQIIEFWLYFRNIFAIIQQKFGLYTQSVTELQYNTVRQSEI